MLRPILVLSAGAAVLATSQVSAEPAGDYLSRALDADSSGPVYQYDLSYRSEDLSVSARIDPSRPLGQRVQVLSPSKSDWNKEITEGVEDLEADPVDDFWCSGFAEMVPRNASLVGQTGTTATYRFQPLPDPNDPDDAKLMKHLVGEITVAKQDPQILSIALTAPQPFKPVWVAKITRFDLSVACERVPDGRTHMREFRITVDGKAALQTLRERELRTITNVRVASN